MSYEEKYLKYKNKYLSLKNFTVNQSGGSFFKMPSLFNTSNSPVIVNQNTIQNEIINYDNLTNRMKTINAKINDQGLTTKIQYLDDNWKKILNTFVNQLKSQEEAQKRYNGLLSELQRKQQNVNELKNTIDSYSPSIKKSLNDAKNFISLLSIEAKNSEAQLAQFESKIMQNNAMKQYNEVVHQRRSSLSEEKKSRSRSSSTSSVKSLGSTPK